MKDIKRIPNYSDYDMLSIISEITQRLKCVYVQRVETDIPNLVVTDVIQGLDDTNFEPLINILKDNYQGFDWWIRSKNDMYFDPRNKVGVFKEFEDVCKEFLDEHQWCESLDDKNLYRFGRLDQVYKLAVKWYDIYDKKKKQCSCGIEHNVNTSAYEKNMIEDLLMVGCLKRIHQTISSIPLVGWDNDYVSEAINELENKYVQFELWLISKSSKDWLQLMELDTIKMFESNSSKFLKEYYNQYCGIDVDKGHYNKLDGFYIVVMRWYKAFCKRHCQVQDWLNSELELALSSLSQQVSGQCLDTEHKQIPEELNIHQAQAYLMKAIELGLMDENYKWRKSKSLCAYFASIMSDKLRLNNSIKGGRNEKKRISWRPFEILFGYERGTLRQAKNDYEKVNIDPQGSDIVDKIFK